MPLPDLLTAFFPGQQPKRRNPLLENDAAIELAQQQSGFHPSAQQSPQALPHEQEHQMSPNVMPQAGAPTAPSPNQPPQSPSQAEQEYEQASGVPYSFYPGSAQADNNATVSAPTEMGVPSSDPRIGTDPRLLAYDEREKLLREGPKRESKLWRRLVGGALRGFGIGMANGGNAAAGAGGAIANALGEGFSPGYNQKMRLPQNLDRVNQQIAGYEQERQADQAYRRQEADIVGAQQRPIIAREELERKKRVDDAKIEQAKNILADKTQGRKLQERQIASLERYREWLIENGAKLTDARIKQIDERLKDADLDRDARIKIAGMTQEGQDRRQQIEIAAKKELQIIRDAAATGRQAEALAARERLAKLKAELDGLDQ